MAVPLLRTLILYCAVICAVRLMGKRQIGELDPSELVVTILVSDLAAVPMQDLGIPLLLPLSGTSFTAYDLLPNRSRGAAAEIPDRCNYGDAAG